MGGLQGVDAVALDCARVALALAGAADVHLFAGGEGVGLDDVADRGGAAVLKAEFPQDLLAGDVRLGEMTLHGLVDVLVRNLAEAELHGIISVVFGRLFLYDDAGTRLDDRDRDHDAVFVKQLGHTELLADDCLLHLCSSFRLLVDASAPT